MKEQLKLYQGYFIITILSLISIFFLPMLGSSIGLSFLLPTTVAGWFVWIGGKVAIILINILLFDQFVRQGKLNIKDNPRFLAAQEIFNNLDSPEEEYLPTPHEYFKKLYLNKGTKLFITSALSLVAFSNAILTFDWVTMLTYLFTVVCGLIFGWITMANVEDYWTDTYYKLALKTQKAAEKEAQKTVELTPAAYVENINTLLEERNNGIKT